MAHKDIILSKKKVRLHKAFIKPDFNKPTILVSDHFDYVELWLKQQKQTAALHFWEQSRNFYNATLSIPIESKPLTAYYCMLNAAKALLVTKSINFSDLHGCSGINTQDIKTSLVSERITIKTDGIIPATSKYFGDISPLGKSIHLKNVLYNIPFIHRAFTTTYSDRNIFIPLTDPHFVTSKKSNEAWFAARISDKQYQDPRIIQSQRGWEISTSEHGSTEFWIRRKRRFRWKHGQRAQNMAKLQRYHCKIRRDVKYIFGQTAMWYLKRNPKDQKIYHWPIPALILIAMHRLSELCRYDPKRLSRHFESQQNWLLAEFLNLAPINFIDNISCEITGRNLMAPGYRSAK